MKIEQALGRYNYEFYIQAQSIFNQLLDDIDDYKILNKVSKFHSLCHYMIKYLASKVDVSQSDVLDERTLTTLLAGIRAFTADSNPESDVQPGDLVEYKTVDGEFGRYVNGRLSPIKYDSEKKQIEDEMLIKEQNNEHI